jgi:small multidrug resistance pump
MSYLFLAMAIAAEITGTFSLKYSVQFTRLWPSLMVILAYSTAFYFLSLSLKSINLGVAYAIWSGVGIVCIALIQFFWFKEPLDLPAVAGMGLIISGVVIINLFSSTVSH